MVIAVGEPPRNYIAQVSTAIVMAAGAWIWAIDRVIARLTRTGARPRLARWGLAVVVGLAVCIGISAIGARAWVTRAGSAGNSAIAVKTTVDWLHANVLDGTPIAFGSYLGYEMAYSLVADYPMYQLRHRTATVDPTMPLGFRRAGEAPADDWVAADTAPRNVNEYQAFRAAWVEDLVRRRNIGYWVYSTGVSTSAPEIQAQLTPDHGFDEVASWDFGSGASARHVAIYRVNLDRLGLDRSHLYISPAALHRLVVRLEQDPNASRAAAAALLPRIVVEPPSSTAEADLARLEDLASP
jgi:hypothetical protein